MPFLIGIALILLLQAKLALGDSFTQIWTFEQAAQQVQTTHPAILSQQFASEAAKADLNSASWQRYPTPALQAARQSNDQNSDHYNSQSSTVLSLQQPLWTGGKITANIDGAKSRFNASEAAIDETRQTVMLTLLDNYTEALRLQARQEYAYKNVHDHEKLLDLVTRRVDQEVTAPIDLKLARARLYQATNNLATITQDFANAMMHISRLAGKNIEQIAPLDADTSDVPHSEKDAQQQAEDHSPTLARLGFEEAMANAEISSKKSEYLPQVDLEYKKTTAGNYIPNGSIPGNSLMLVMKIQPGAGLSSFSGASSAIAKRQATRQNRDAELRELQIKISTDWNVLNGARLRFENATILGKISDDVFESNVRQYTTGKKLWLEVLNSAQEASVAKMSAVDAAAQINRSALRLRLLTGNLKVTFTTN